MEQENKEDSASCMCPLAQSVLACPLPKELTELREQSNKVRDTGLKESFASPVFIVWGGLCSGIWHPRPLLAFFLSSPPAHVPWSPFPLTSPEEKAHSLTEDCVPSPLLKHLAGVSGLGDSVFTFSSKLYRNCLLVCSFINHILGYG